MHWIEDSQLNHMSRQAYVQAPVLCVITLTIATSLSLYNIFGQPSAYSVNVLFKWHGGIVVRMSDL